MKYNYTEDQLKAIETSESCFLVLGSAGTGKTHVLVERVLHLVSKQHLQIEKLLILTSNMNDMYQIKEKLNHEVDVSKLSIFTMDMFALKIILDFEGYQKRFVSESYLNDIREACIKHFCKTDKTYLDYLRNPKVYPNITIDAEKMYLERIENEKLILRFNPVSYALNLLKKHDSLRQAILNKYHTVIIDNAQDYQGEYKELIQTITNNTQDIYVLGNDDQRLSSSALNETYLKLVYDSKKFNKIVLVDNYKTDKSIMKLATMIYHNQDRFEKVSKYMVDAHYKPSFSLHEFRKDISEELIKDLDRLHQEGISYQNMILIVSNDEEKSHYQTVLNRSKMHADNPISALDIESEATTTLMMHADLNDFSDKDFSLFERVLTILNQSSVLLEDKNQMLGWVAQFERVTRSNDLKEFILYILSGGYTHVFEYMEDSVQVLLLDECRGLDFQYVFVPDVKSLLNDDIEQSRRILYNTLYTARNFIYLYGLKNDQHQVIDEIKEIISNWNGVKVPSSLYKNIIQSEATYLTRDLQITFERVLEKYKNYPKLSNELTYLIELIKNFDVLLNKGDKTTNVDIYMQAFRYFIQHTLKVTMDTLHGEKRTVIASYLSGGSSGVLDLEADYKKLILNDCLSEKFSTTELKGIHDIYRYLSATHHKNDDRKLSNQDLKQASENISIYRRFSNKEKINYYVSVIKFFDHIKLSDKKLQVIESSIE